MDYIYVLTLQDGTEHREYLRENAFEYYKRNHCIRIATETKDLFPTRRVIVNKQDYDLNNVDENDYIRKTTIKRRKQLLDYDNTHCKQFKLKLNLETDADVIEFLQNSGNMQGTIKELIREKIAENNAQKGLIPTYISDNILMYPIIV